MNGKIWCQFSFKYAGNVLINLTVYCHVISAIRILICPGKSDQFWTRWRRAGCAELGYYYTNCVRFICVINEDEPFCVSEHLRQIAAGIVGIILLVEIYGQAIRSILMYIKTANMKLGINRDWINNLTENIYVIVVILLRGLPIPLCAQSSSAGINWTQELNNLGLCRVLWERWCSPGICFFFG